MHTTLDGTVALVTGGGSGLGSAVCRRLAADGARVVVNDIDPVAATAVADAIGGDVAVFDVADPTAFDAAVDAAVSRHGRLDVLVNNAGIAPPMGSEQVELLMLNQMARFEGRLDDLRPTDATVNMLDVDWDRMIKVHLYGAFHGTRAALRHMTPARAGSVINVSSVMALRPMSGAMHYAAAKAGILALTRSVGAEVAAFGVRVNAICPGWVDTPLLDSMDPIVRTALVGQIPRGRMGTAEEIAELVRFLAGPDSSYCCGDVFTTSGGVA